MNCDHNGAGRVRVRVRVGGAYFRAYLAGLSSAVPCLTMLTRQPPDAWRFNICAMCWAPMLVSQAPPMRPTLAENGGLNALGVQLHFDRIYYWQDKFPLGGDSKNFPLPLGLNLQNLQ